jgi:hypothetical protein
LALLLEAVLADLDVGPTELQRLRVNVILKSLSLLVHCVALVQQPAELLGTSLEIEQILHEDLLEHLFALRCPLVLLKRDCFSLF